MREKFAGKKMLLVEDEEGIRDFLEEEFREQGFHVVTAPCAESALTHLHDGAFDILVADHQTPGHLTGLDLAIRARSFEKKLPAVILTRRPDLVEGALSDSEVVVRKPLAFGRVLRGVESLLG